MVCGDLDGRCVLVEGCVTLPFDETPLDTVLEGWSEIEMPPKGADPGGPCCQGLALSFASPKVGFCGCSRRLRGLIRETGGHWDASVSPKVGERDTCRGKSLCSSIFLGKASW